MKRLIDTSVGQVVLDFVGQGQVDITVLNEHGWAIKDGEWGDAELARGLLYVAGVPEEEAEAIERAVLPEWISRGGKPKGAWESTSWGLNDVKGITFLGLLLTCIVVGIVTIGRWVFGLF